MNERKRIGFDLKISICIGIQLDPFKPKILNFNWMLFVQSFLLKNKLKLSLCLFFYSLLVVDGWFPTTLKLERVFDHPTQLSLLRDRDVRRRNKILQPRPYDFPVLGDFDFDITGFYYTKIELGSPPKEYYLLIDTGSDALWVSCSACNGCPISSELNIPLEFYDPSRSSTASMISCSDRWCSLASKFYETGCSRSNNRCTYSINYGYHSNISGYYVHDMMHMNTPGVASNSSAYLVFGCTTFQTGHFATRRKALDGIFGLGPLGPSLIKQLSSQGATPGVFSHCLVGNKSGGGILAIGQISEPNLVYTPLVQSQPHYNVNLQRISVNGRMLSIDPSAFAVSGNHGGTIIDSGTSLAFLPEKAFYPFVNAITDSVIQSTQPLISNESWCYLITSSASKIFPTISFEFAGDAVMVLRPEDYLVQESSVDGTEKWCIGFHRSIYEGITILGDLVLKDKLVVYDLDCQRIGWKNYDCSSPVNVSSTPTCGKSKGENGRKSNSNYLRVTSYKHLFLVLIFVVSCYSTDLNACRNGSRQDIYVQKLLVNDDFFSFFLDEHLSKFV